MIRLDRPTFFARVRSGPFPGRLTQGQVAGMTDLLNEWDTRGTDDPRHLAYTLAIDFHETGQKMQPVREGFKKTDKEARAYVQRNYGHKGPDWYCWPTGPWSHVYYGRGDVQLTWFRNYVLMGQILNIPLAEKPDLALKYSKAILIEGMLRGASDRGDFTGKSLEDYFNDHDDDPVNARRIVNGTDKARLIAGYYEEFLDAIHDAMKAYEEPVFDGTPKVEPPKTAKLPGKTDGTSWGLVATVLGGLAGSADLGDIARYAAWGLLAVGVIVFVAGRIKLIRDTGE